MIFVAAARPSQWRFNMTSTIRVMRHRRCVRRVTGTAALALVMACGAGCGNNVADLLYQGVTAAGNTALDLWLTQFANDLADQFNPPPDDGADLPRGDAAAGEQTFIAKGCSVCHGPSAEGGLGPELAGVNQWETMIALFGEGGVHRGTTLSEEEIEDVATWILTADSGGEVEIPDGDAAAGQAAYDAADCAACHGAAGEGGSAPALADMNEFADLKTRFSGGASHFGRTLAEADIENVATWLLGGETGGGDQAIGEQAFSAAGCSSCHGAAGSGGTGPALAGNDETAALESRFGGGATHFGATLSDADIAEVAAWLAAL